MREDNIRLAAKALEVLTKAFGAERALRADHARLRKSWQIRRVCVVTDIPMHMN